MNKFLLLISASFLSSGVAYADGICAPHYKELASDLNSKWGEVPVFEGLDSGTDKMIVVTGNTQTGTFTILSVDPNGRACLLSSGKNMALTTNKPGKDL